MPSLKNILISNMPGTSLLLLCSYQCVALTTTINFCPFPDSTRTMSGPNLNIPFRLRSLHIMSKIWSRVGVARVVQTGWWFLWGSGGRTVIKLSGSAFSTDTSTWQRLCFTVSCVVLHLVGRFLISGPIVTDFVTWGTADIAQFWVFFIVRIQM